MVIEWSSNPLFRWFEKPHSFSKVRRVDIKRWPYRINPRFKRLQLARSLDPDILQNINLSRRRISIARNVKATSTPACVRNLWKLSCHSHDPTPKDRKLLFGVPCGSDSDLLFSVIPGNIQISVTILKRAQFFLNRKIKNILVCFDIEVKERIYYQDWTSKNEFSVRSFFIRPHHSQNGLNQRWECRFSLDATRR